MFFVGSPLCACGVAVVLDSAIEAAVEGKEMPSPTLWTLYDADVRHLDILQRVSDQVPSAQRPELRAPKKPVA